MTVGRRRWVILMAAAVLTLGVGCAEEEPEDPDTAGNIDTEAEAAVNVSLQAFDFRFDTETIPVELGAVVELTLQNSGAVAHSFTVPDLDVEIEAEGGDSASVNFAVPETPGAYEFICKFHPDEMTGTLTVGGEEGEVPEGTEVDDDEDVDEDDDADVEVDVEDDSTP